MMKLMIFDKDGSVMGYMVSEFAVLDSEEDIFWTGTDDQEEKWPKEGTRKVLVDGVIVWESGEDVE